MGSSENYTSVCGNTLFTTQNTVKGLRILLRATVTLSSLGNKNGADARLFSALQNQIGNSSVVLNEHFMRYT